MDKIVIEGGERLVGDVVISGAKNAALPLLAASILAEGTTIFENVPTLEDIRTTRKLLSNLGAKVDADEDKHTVSVDASKLTSHEAPYELVKTMRASSLVLG
ncbi:MAG: UDP-N-acetylglucosamine 1-carboxyvinyltransferase, partial [Deltaproteobacteria bacterium]